MPSLTNGPNGIFDVHALFLYPLSSGHCKVGWDEWVGGTVGKWQTIFEL